MVYLSSGNDFEGGVHENRAERIVCNEHANSILNKQYRLGVLGISRLIQLHVFASFSFFSVLYTSFQLAPDRHQTSPPAPLLPMRVGRLIFTHKYSAPRRTWLPSTSANQRESEKVRKWESENPLACLRARPLTCL